MNWKEAEVLLSEGKMITRPFLSWSEKHFIFKQVPSTIGKDIVPKMQSLPQSVKDEFQRRFDSPSEQLTEIYYDDQYALVGPSNQISGWLPKEEDILSPEWEEYRP